MTDSVKVIVRVRGLNQQEKNDGANSCLQVQSNNLKVKGDGDDKIFSFDHVMDQQAQQEQLYDLIGNQIIDQVINGFNVTVFAYGQTGAGKTYTMQGKNNDGIQQKIIKNIFEKLTYRDFKMKANYLEVYNENIYDLLSQHQGSLQIREDVQKGVFVENISDHVIKNFEDALEVIKIGQQKRHIACHNQNAQSSRSHSILTINLQTNLKSNNITINKKSKLNFIDLAGSERQKKSGTSGEHLKEASSINKSLTILGNVINTLASQSLAKKKHVPYRDSKLTFLLKDSLGGNSKTFLIAAVTESSTCIQVVFLNQETVSTLKFAQKSKLIKTVCSMNQEFQGSIETLQDEIKRLRSIINTRITSENENEIQQKNTTMIDHVLYQEVIAKNLEQFKVFNDIVKIYETLVKEYKNIYETISIVISQKPLDFIQKIFQKNIHKYENQKIELSNTFFSAQEQYSNQSQNNLQVFFQYQIIKQNQEILNNLNNMINQSETKEILSVAQIIQQKQSLDEQLIQQKEHFKNIIDQKQKQIEQLTSDPNLSVQENFPQDQIREQETQNNLLFNNLKARFDQIQNLSQFDLKQIFEELSKISQEEDKQQLLDLIQSQFKKQLSQIDQQNQKFEDQIQQMNQKIITQNDKIQNLNIEKKQLQQSQQVVEKQLRLIQKQQDQSEQYCQENDQNINNKFPERQKRKRNVQKNKENLTLQNTGNSSLDQFFMTMKRIKH